MKELVKRFEEYVSFKESLKSLCETRIDTYEEQTPIRLDQSYKHFFENLHQKIGREGESLDREDIIIAWAKTQILSEIQELIYGLESKGDENDRI
jgi:hypothetical protein